MGRDGERKSLDELVARCREGFSGAVVLRGEAGIGKTTLLDYVSSTSTTGVRVIRLSGVEAEAGFPFAAVQRLVGPSIVAVDRLPAPQARALMVACGLREGPAAAVFLVGMAVLSVLAGWSKREPILVCVDDAHWLDEESQVVLGFVARRVHAEGIAIVFGMRDSEHRSRALDGVPTIELTGLDSDSALELLRSVVKQRVDDRIGRRVVTATGGNPLALTDLGLVLSAQQLVGGTLLPEPVPIGRYLESHYLAQIRRLPDDTQRWLLLAAAEPTGDPGCVNRAAASMGIADDVAGPAERDGIVAVGSTIEFRHPLVRSAAYAGATSADRRAAHAALALATTPSSWDRRLWHLAAASAGPDETVAIELERAADGAHKRGGLSARAQYLTRAAELTPDVATRERRMSQAAAAALDAGAPLQAAALIDAISDGALDAADRARILLCSGHTNVQIGERGASARLPAMCLEAALLSVDLAPEALLAACIAAIAAEQLIAGTSVVEIALAAERLTTAAGPSLTTTMVGAFARLVTAGYERAAPDIRNATRALCSPDVSDDEFLRHYLLGVTLCMMTWDDSAQAAVLGRAASAARARGALRHLDTILFCQSMMQTILGNLTAADIYVVEGHQTRAALGATELQWEIYRHPELLAWHADAPALRDIVNATAAAGEYLGHGAIVSITRIAEVVLDLGHGNYADAAATAQSLIEGDVLGVHSRVLPDLVEGASRSGQQELAADALATLESRTRGSASPRAFCVATRSRALLASPDEADDLYQQALELLTHTPAVMDLARTHLLYGEWLRRRARKNDAREQLQTAYDRFTTIGATAFAARAGGELAAIGVRVPANASTQHNTLTAQESQVARLAGRGDTNAEIAARLFISPLTVDYHLRKVYRKLGVRSRRDLRRLGEAVPTTHSG